MIWCIFHMHLHTSYGEGSIAQHISVLVECLHHISRTASLSLYSHESEMSAHATFSLSGLRLSPRQPSGLIAFCPALDGGDMFGLCKS